MRKIIPIIAVLAMSPVLGGCSWQTFLEGAEDLYTAVQTSVGVARSAIITECARVGDAVAAVNQLAQNSPASCKARTEVLRYATGVASFCNDPDSINKASIPTILAKLKKAKQDARAAIAAGC